MKTSGSFSWLCLSLVLILYGPNLSMGQVGNCDTAEAEATLDVNDVRARIYNNGSLFWKWDASEHFYQVPKDTIFSAIETSNFLITGYLDGQLRFSGSQYDNEFLPGPLDDEGNPPHDCSKYDKIWEIRSEDIQRIDFDGIATQNVLDWPWELGAPVIDGDGDPSNYNPHGGDRPELLGDQTLWWVMNDKNDSFRGYEEPPLGIEVHGSAYAFNHPILSRVTFYRYVIHNKNDSPLEDTFVGMFADVPIGNSNENYFGSDSLLHLGFQYKADAVDGGYYEDKPPALGYTFLITPNALPDGHDNDRDGEVDEPGEQVGMFSARTYLKTSNTVGDPDNGVEMRRYMTGRWKQGSRLAEGGIGYYQGEWPNDFFIRFTRFSYSGDPLTGSFWSQYQPFPGYPPHNTGGVRLLTSAGPFDLQPGEKTQLLVAVVFTQGEDNLDSIRKLKELVYILQLNPQSFLGRGNSTGSTSIQSVEQDEIGFEQNFPNPFSGVTTLRYSLPESMQVRLAVYDMLGREVAVLSQGPQAPGVYSIDFDGSSLPAGIYYARIEMDHVSFTRKLVLVP